MKKELINEKIRLENKMLKSKGQDSEIKEKDLEPYVNIFKDIPIKYDIRTIEEVEELSESSDD